METIILNNTVVYLKYVRYQNHQIGVWAYNNDTVFSKLTAYFPNNELHSDEVAIKDWDEYEGLYLQLLQQEVCHFAEKRYCVGVGRYVHVVRLTGKYLKL